MGETQFLQNRLGYLSGIIDRPEGGKTDERETLEPSGVPGEPPPLFDRRDFPPSWGGENQCWRNSRATSLFQQSRLGF